MTNTKTNVNIIQNLLRMLRTKPDAIPHLQLYADEAKRLGYRDYKKLKYIKAAINKGHCGTLPHKSA